MSVVFGSFYHNVIGFDTNKEKIATLKEGVSTIDETGVQVLLNEAKPYLRFSTNFFAIS